MTPLESRFLVTRTRLESRWEKWWLDSSHVFHRMFRLDSSHSQWLVTRVRVVFTKSLNSWWTNPLRLHTKKWAFFLLESWSRLAEIFCFACLVVLCCILRLKCPQLTKRETWDLVTLRGQQNTIYYWQTPYRGLIQYLHILIMAVGLILWPQVFSRYQ